MKQIIIKFRARPYFWSIIILVVALGGYFYYKSGQTTPPETLTVARKNIIQDVSVTGTTKPAETVDLSFENAGRISEINVVVGSRVEAGTTLARIDAGELVAQLAQANSEVAAARAELQELKRGARVEDIAVTRAELAQAEQALANLYQGIPDILNDAHAKANDAVRKQTSGLFYNEETSPQFAISTTNSSAKNKAENQRLQASKELSTWKTELGTISPFSPTSTLLQHAQNAKIHLSMISGFLNTTMDALIGSANLVNQTTLATYQANVTTGINNVNTAVSNINTREQAIASQVLAVTKAQNQLTRQLAGAAGEELEAQEARVAQAEANVSLIQARLSKTALRSPLTGVVTRQDGKVGTIASPSVPVVSVISSGQLEIEASITEIDIGKVAVGNRAKITLDAYGDGVEFMGRVIFIEPAATVVEGVPTYKTTFQFETEDARIKPGMTANIEIRTAEKENTLVLPQRSIIYENNKTYVVIPGDNKTETRQEVTLGLRGSDGNVEIVSGVSEGTEVLRSPK